MQRLKEIKLELNNTCHMECLHCSSRASSSDSTQLDYSVVVSILEEFCSLGGENLAISGGEPLLYSRLDEVLKLSKKHGLKTSLYTTGITLKNSRYCTLADSELQNLSQFVDSMILSVHGASATTHDSITQVDGSFQLTLTALKAATKLGIPTEIHFVPMANNYLELPSLMHLCRDIGVGRISLLRFVPQGRGMKNQADLHLSKEKLKDLRNLIKVCIREFPDVDIRLGSPFNILALKECTECMAGIDRLTIRPNGNICPCDAFKGFEYQGLSGNVREKRLAVIWRSSPYLEEIRNLLQLPLFKDCADCELLDKCRSGCIAQKAIRGGKLYIGKDPDCMKLHRVSPTGLQSTFAFHEA